MSDARTQGALIHNLNDLLEAVQCKLLSRCSSTRDCIERLPNWFRDLGTPVGIATLERRIGHTIPEALRLFYMFPATGCSLLGRGDTDILLEYCPMSERPHLVQWYYRPHLVLAELPHSQLVIAVELDTENPRIEWGDDGARNPLNYPPQYFIQWLTTIAEDIIVNWSANECEQCDQPKLRNPAFDK